MYFIYTDGACSGNNSSKICPGGCGYVVIINEYDLALEGGSGFHNTTNNCMELTAVVAGLTRLNQYLTKNNKLTSESECTIVTDSKYVCDNWNDYFETWKSNGWKKSSGRQVAHIDLWKKIDEISSDFKSITFQWVKGHSDNQYNNRADEIAQNNILLIKNGSK
jgi:ribonuclease HI